MELFSFSPWSKDRYSPIILREGVFDLDLNRSSRNYENVKFNVNTC